MARCRHPIAALVLLSASPLVAAPAVAQVARSGGANASAQLVEQMQQLASERTTLQAENEKLKKELADITRDRNSLKAGQLGIARRAQESSAALAHSNSERDQAAHELEQAKAKMQELIAKFRETIQKLRDTETADATDKQSLAARERELSVCVDRNVALHRLNEEVLARLDQTGFWQKAAMAEPFTRIKRIQNDNLVDEYRSRAQQLQVAPQAAAPASTSAPPGAADPAASPK